jgi:hypothetical protein
MAAQKEAQIWPTRSAPGQDRQSTIHITMVIPYHHSFDTEVVTGKRIEQKANIPAGFCLYRRVRGGNEPIRDDESAELHHGDHFFSRRPALSGVDGGSRSCPGVRVRSMQHGL